MITLFTVTIWFKVFKFLSLELRDVGLKHMVLWLRSSRMLGHKDFLIFLHSESDKTYSPSKGLRK